MEKKVIKTTYQKLKEERIKLLNDIRVMIMSPNSESAMMLKIEYKFRFQAEDIMFFGDATNDKQLNK